MSLKPFVVSQIIYTNAKGDKSERTIMPTSVPATKPVIKAFDVSDLSEDDVIRLESQYAEYQAYRKQAIDNLFDFNDFVDQIGQPQVEGIKFRSFSPGGIELV